MKISLPAHPPSIPSSTSRRPSREGIQKGDLPSLPSPLVGEGEGEGYFQDNDKETKSQKVMHIFNKSVKIFSDA